MAALHWVRENIEAFGGDKNQVTLMGQGYGAAMVHLLLISPVTKGLSQGMHNGSYPRSVTLYLFNFEIRSCSTEKRTFKVKHIFSDFVAIEHGS